jgi:hypothetical protein
MGSTIINARSVYNKGVKVKAARPGYRPGVYGVNWLLNGAGESALGDLGDADIIDGAGNPIATGDLVAVADDAGLSGGVYRVGATEGELVYSFATLRSMGFSVITVGSGDTYGGKIFTLDNDDSGVTEVSEVPETTDTISTLHAIIAYNSGASDCYIQIHDTASTPSEGAVPAIAIPIAAGGYGVFDFGSCGRPIKAGLYVCGSSTDDTKTLIGAADLLIDITYSK